MSCGSGYVDTRPYIEIKCRLVPNSRLRAKMEQDMVTVCKAQELTNEDFFRAIERMTKKWT